MNTSALDVTLVPPDVETVISTGPAETTGEVTVKLVVEAAVTLALVVPNLTISFAAVASKLLPLMMTVVPPVVGPLVGEMEVTTGGVPTCKLKNASLVPIDDRLWVGRKICSVGIVCMNGKCAYSRRGYINLIGTTCVS